MAHSTHVPSPDVGPRHNGHASARVESGIYRRSMSPFSENGDDLIQLRVGSDNGSAQGGAVPQKENRGETPGLRLQVKRKENMNARDVVRMTDGIHHSETACCLTLARTSDSRNGFQLVARSSTPAVSSSFAEQGNPFDDPFDVAGSIGADSESPLFARTADAGCHSTANTLTLFAKEFALVEHLIAEYSSLFVGAFDPDLADTRFEEPRPVPAVPKRGPLRATKQRISFSTRASSKSEPVSRNFRRLRLDVQRSVRSIHEMQSDQESPDWACQTSLAIEAGIVSMDNIHIHGGESTPGSTIRSTPRHIFEAMRSPTKIFSPDHRRVQSSGPEVKKTACPSPSKDSLDRFAAGRHSEGALQLMQGVNVARLLGKFQKTEAKVREEPLRHDCVRISSRMDLNKSLPALPLQKSKQDGKGWYKLC